MRSEEYRPKGERDTAVRMKRIICFTTNHDYIPVFFEFSFISRTHPGEPPFLLWLLPAESFIATRSVAATVMKFLQNYFARLMPPCRSSSTRFTGIRNNIFSRRMGASSSPPPPTTLATGVTHQMPPRDLIRLYENHHENS